MTFAPPTLVELGRLWVAYGGVNLGIVGDTAHQSRGVSYHLGRDQLAPGAYSARTPRDVRGLSNAASAIDLGRLGGTLKGLQDFSRWLVGRVRDSAAGTGDMREIIYSPDGVQVLRWDRERGATSLPRSGEADDSHRTHTHVSWYRDAEARDHTTAFRPYFEEASMVKFTVPANEVEGKITTKVTTLAVPITGGNRPSLRAGLTRPAMGGLGDDMFRLTELENRPVYLMLAGPQIVFVNAADVDFVPADADGSATASTPQTIELRVDDVPVFTKEIM